MTSIGRRRKAIIIITMATIAFALFVVPVGYPATYGRLTGERYAPFWSIPAGMAVDSLRVVLTIGCALVIGTGCVITSEGGETASSSRFDLPTVRSMGGFGGLLALLGLVLLVAFVAFVLYSAIFR